MVTPFPRPASLSIPSANPLQGIHDWLSPRSNMLLGVGAGLLSGDLGNVPLYAMEGRKADTAYAAAQQQEAERQQALQDQQALRAKYSDFFRQQNEPELADLVASDQGPAPGDLYWKWREANGQGTDPSKTPGGRAALGGQYGLEGDALTRYVLTGQMPADRTANAPTLTSIYTDDGGEQRGYMTPEGFVPVGASKAAPAPKPEFNVSQATAAGYADRMAQADAILSDPKITAVQSDIWEQRGGTPLVGNLIASTEYQQADQAQRDFINAILRRESGAVISDNEFANARRQYFPQPGDNEAVVRQKAANRRNAIAGVARAAGPAYTPPDTTNYLNNPQALDPGIEALVNKWLQQ